MHNTLYSHYSAYPGPWFWRNFSAREIACRHCGELALDSASMDALQFLRNVWDRPIVITSAHRCREHNRAVGGAPHSRHLQLAFDCVCPASMQDAFAAAAAQAGFTGIGRYSVRRFVHLDCGPARQWREDGPR